MYIPYFISVKLNQEKMSQGTRLFESLPPPAVKPSNNRSQFASTLSKSTQVYLQKIQLQF
jgi:hypothetical protein